ncbi:hypothetical protein EDE15_0440 [Edaphobacter aggregans]|uniref:Uncharacterized protein n=1 Tax=Edaphobacter aggregans TaxID=570835 RepID=A0A3R9R0G0_9BACT|nr:hypothetical protein EDE15_0440 [Edaphobacter aggregans]
MRSYSSCLGGAYPTLVLSDRKYSCHFWVITVVRRLEIDVQTSRELKASSCKHAFVASFQLKISGKCKKKLRKLRADKVRAIKIQGRRALHTTLRAQLDSMRSIVLTQILQSSGDDLCA